MGIVNQQKSQIRKLDLANLGAYIRIKDNSWTLAVEYCLRHLLSVWLCDNVQDRNILDSILQKYNIRAVGYIISKYFFLFLDLFI